MKNLPRHVERNAATFAELNNLLEWNRYRRPRGQTDAQRTEEAPSVKRENVQPRFSLLVIEVAVFLFLSRFFSLSLFQGRGLQGWVFFCSLLFLLALPTRLER